MHDSAPGRHPVDLAGTDRLMRAEAVAVDDLALDQIRHRRQADVRMRTHVESLTGRHRLSAHLVEEGERSNHTARRRGKDATDSEATELTGPRIDHVRDRRHSPRPRTRWFDDGPEAHWERGIARISAAIS